MTGSPVPFAHTRQTQPNGVVLFTLTGDPRDREFDEFLESVAAFLRTVERGEERARIVMDPGGLTRFDAPLRQVYGEWRAENADLIRRSVARAAYVTRSAMWRGIVTAVFWVSRPVVPVQTFRDREAAIEWAGRSD